MFDKAIDAAPSIVVIEEMESYLADRQMHESTGLHHVEEVGGVPAPDPRSPSAPGADHRHNEPGRDDRSRDPSPRAVRPHVGGRTANARRGVGASRGIAAKGADARRIRHARRREGVDRTGALGHRVRSPRSGTACRPCRQGRRGRRHPACGACGVAPTGARETAHRIHPLLTMDLADNPFYTLGATTDDDRRRIAELAEEKSLVGDEDSIRDARGVLTNPRRRLAAEVGWLPGLGTKRVAEVISLLEVNPSEVRRTTGLPALARANLLADAMVRDGSLARRWASCTVDCRAVRGPRAGGSPRGDVAPERGKGRPPASPQSPIKRA